MHQLLARLASLLSYRPTATRSRCRRRPVPAPPATRLPAGGATRAEPPPPAATPRDPVPSLRGEDTALVRPYVLAHEATCEEARRQRARRRTLWFALHGVDLGPRVIHGVEVAA